MNSIYSKRGTVITIGDTSDVQVLEHLPVGTYTVRLNPMSGYYLEQANNLTRPSKIYGNYDSLVNRYLTTFAGRPNGTGVFLAGVKGTGKTLLSKLLSVTALERGISTIIITEAHHGEAFNKFISSISDPAVLLFEEIDKVYSRDEVQALLTLFDGLFTTKKMSVLTCNDPLHVGSHMTNRPGRMFYFKNFAGIDREVVRAYMEDNYKGVEDLNKVLSEVSSIPHLTFDIMQAIVEEMNRYQEPLHSVLAHLNVRPEPCYSYTVDNIDGPFVEERMADNEDSNERFAKQVGYVARPTDKKGLLDQLKSMPIQTRGGRDEGFHILGEYFNMGTDLKEAKLDGRLILETENGDKASLVPMETYRSAWMY